MLLSFFICSVIVVKGLNLAPVKLNEPKQSKISLVIPHSLEVATPSQSDLLRNVFALEKVRLTLAVEYKRSLYLEHTSFDRNQMI